MNAVVEFLVSILGYVMLFCYFIVKNYGASIILFTLLTKAILFPISILTQKNSIRMVQMQPELNALKIKYIDDKDKFTDEQLLLYKKYKYNPFLDSLPLLIQIPIVLGLVGVVYRPLAYVLNIPRDVIMTMNDWLTNTLGVTDAGNMYQLEILEQIRSGVIPGGIAGNIIEQIQSLNMNFLGLDLSLKPSFTVHPETLIIPVLSGVSAWLLCFAQNRINVLQIAQNRALKIATTVFMIAFSTYFAFLVPGGVGLYWIFGNLFAIPLLALTNAVIPPKKYVDYDLLLKTKEQARLKELEQRKYVKREKADYKRFFSAEKMRLMIYSESNGFYKYFSDMIDYVYDNSDIYIHYVTSDPNDKIFEDPRSRIKSYYIASDRYLVPLFMKLDCDMCVMTMPDLEKYHIKRSRVRGDIEYLYVMHGVGSYVMPLRKGALDWFDSVLCISPENESEIRDTEELYGTKPKTLIEAGYPLIDRMIEDYEKSEKRVNARPKILIAPSWQPDNIIELCGEELIDSLKSSDYDIILRPHPQMVRHVPELFEELHKKYDGTNVEIQTDFSSNNPILEADVLITDWSGIALEFAFTTKRPVLFIDTPMKVLNSDYSKISTKPLDVTLRDKVGKSMAVADIAKADEIVKEFLNNRTAYADKIEKALHEHVFNVGQSKKVYGRYVLKRLGII